MERTDRAAIATFFAGDEPLRSGAMLSLGEHVARHVRALRQSPGHEIRLTDGAGRRASGTLVRVAGDAVTVQLREIEELAPLPPVHLLVPIGDKERMLWLAEKATEMGIATWRPVLWRRSRSVRPRGEGPTFALKSRARMISALEQSGGAHLPLAHPEAPPDRAIAALPPGSRIILDPSAEPLLGAPLAAPVSIALGPEGGLEDAELDLLDRAQFVRASLGPNILRFETAALAAVAVVRAALHANRGAAS